MSITLYGISNCDTIKRTRKWLTDQGLDFDFHDYKKAGCSEELARQFITEFGVEKAVNRRGTTWRALSDEQKANLDETSAIELMSQYPAMIKRPILQAANQWLIGFDEAGWGELLVK